MARSRGFFAVAAVATAAVVFAVVTALLLAVARWAERDFAAYPYLAGEDPIRVLLPTVQKANREDTLLLGPSSLGEALRYEDLQEAWGGRVIMGAISTATLDELRLALDYAITVYGADALPGRIVLGLDPRVVANIPRRFGASAERPAGYLIDLVNDYSAQLSVQSTSTSSVLQPKGPLASLLARARFYATKQQARIRAGVLAAVERFLDPDPVKLGWQDEMPHFQVNFRWLSDKRNASVLRQLAADRGVISAAVTWMRAYRSPYTSQFYKPIAEKDVRLMIESDWSDVLTWTPAADEAIVTEQLAWIDEFARRNGIELVVLYLPLHELIRAELPPDNVEWIRTATARYLPSARFVESWDSIESDAFVDNVHVTPRAARIVTGQLLASVPKGPRTRENDHE